MAARQVDYLNRVLETASVNLSLQGKVVFADRSFAEHEYLSAAGQYGAAHRADYAFLLVNREDGRGQSVWPGNVGWYSMNGNVGQKLARHFGILNGAGHASVVPWAMGYRSGFVGTLMRRDVPVVADLYSDHERVGWGDAQHTVSRLLREKYGRYTRWQGVIAPPTR